MNRKEYRIADLASILGVSEVAIRKKVKEGLYKQRFEVVTKLFNNKQTAFILLSDEELEEEKQLAFKNKNKFSQQNVNSTVEETEYIEVSPEKVHYNETLEDKYTTFTKLYIDKVENLYSTLYETQKETLEKDKQIYLLETSESRMKSDVLEVQAENKTLKIQNKRYLITLIILITTMIISSIPISYILAKHFLR